MTNFLNAPNRNELFALGITAVAFSRAMFHFFDDPEGPNLLIVGVTAAIVFAVSLATYKFVAPAPGAKRFGLAILVQALFVFVLYFLGITF